MPCRDSPWNKFVVERPKTRIRVKMPFEENRIAFANCIIPANSFAVCIAFKIGNEPNTPFSVPHFNFLRGMASAYEIHRKIIQTQNIEKIGRL